MDKISIIAIVARDGAIGRGGDQPFHIREDFRRFKSLTMGKPLVMGRRTFEALPSGALPGRRNIVVSRRDDFCAPGVEVGASLEKAIEMAGGEVMVIGGGEIYRQAMPLATHLYITEVDADVPDADTHFPAIDSEIWQTTDISDYATDPRSGARYRFVDYSRR